MSNLVRVGVLMLAWGLCGCGDRSDPKLETIQVQENGTMVQEYQVKSSGSNTIPDSVTPSSTFLLSFDEPVDLTTATEHIYVEDQNGNRLEGTVKARLNDIVLTPAAPMTAGENHSIVVEKGIDDASENTTDWERTIVFFVE